MWDVGCGMRDAGCGMRDVGCGMQDAELNNHRDYRIEGKVGSG